MHTILVLFGWPDGTNGQVWPNVIPGVISGVVVWLAGLTHLKRVHKAHQKAIEQHVAQSLSDYLTARNPE